MRTHTYAHTTLQHTHTQHHTRAPTHCTLPQHLRKDVVARIIPHAAYDYFWRVRPI
jgi:hypothetical protein